MRATFGQLAPDQPDLLNGNLEDAVNCIPYEQSYGPFPGPAVYGASVSATVIGAISVRSQTDGTVFTTMGTQGSLWKDSAGAVNNISRTASYTTAADGRWDGTVFGDIVQFVNGIDPIQVYTIGTSSQYLDISTSASAPVAACIATVRDFNMLGRLSTNLNAVQWSRINNCLRYGLSVNNQADSQVLAGTGAVKKITGGDFAAILTEESAWRGSYTGSPLIFRFDETAPGAGTAVPGLVARHQSLTIYYSTRGWVAYDGNQAVPIGEGWIDEFFKDDFESGSKHNCSAVIDPVNKLYIGMYPSRSGTGYSNRAMLWRIGTDKWARAELSLDFIFSVMSGGYTLEGLDAVMPNIDLGTLSLDSDAWKGGLKGLGGFDTGHRLVRFDGDALTARFITGEAQIIEDGRAFIRAIRPLIEGNATTSLSAYVGGRDRLIDTVTWSSAVAMNSIGKCPFRANNRYQRLRLDIAGGFTRAYGADVDVVSAGMR
jgi:hypothetical protein